ncbi:hypothetical protein FMGBMHLM_1947 [Methylobacterium aerolatum]|nr:hypothetical protein FMGBMHLM_1947 [Methylobacterium aerolatum]
MVVPPTLAGLVALLLVQSLQATAMMPRGARRLAAQENVQIVRGHLGRTLANAMLRRRDGRRVTFLRQGGHMVATIAADRGAGRVSEMLVGLLAAETPGATGLSPVETAHIASGGGAIRFAVQDEAGLIDLTAWPRPLPEDAFRATGGRPAPRLRRDRPDDRGRGWRPLTRRY